MRSRHWLVVLSCGTAAACANILGLDDGVPRLDASVIDASVDVAPDVSPDVGAEGGPDSPIHCGTKSCNFAAGEACCLKDAGSACVTSQAACKGDYIPCDRSEQCPQGDAGAVECCGAYVLTDAGAVTTGVSCVLKTKCTAANSDFVLCGDDSGAACPPDASCGVSTLTLPTFLICR